MFLVHGTHVGTNVPGSNGISNLIVLGEDEEMSVLMPQLPRGFISAQCC